MKFMVYIAFFLIFIAFFGIFLLKKYFFSPKKRIENLVIGEFIHKKSAEFGETYFSSNILRKIVTKLLLSDSKQAKDILFLLCHGKKYEVVRDYFITNNQKYLAAGFCAFSNLEFAEEIFSEISNINEGAKVQIAYINLLKGNKEIAQDIINDINIKKLSDAESAVFYYCRAKFALEIGDLYNASDDISNAITLFHKTKSLCEEAKSYLMLGEIYRVSAVCDMAYFMYDEARKIAVKLHYDALNADILGNIGMLYTMQERFEAAYEFFIEALEINKRLLRDQAIACIYNQLALLKLLEEKYDEATDYINQSLRFQIPDTNAMSYELSAKVHFAKKNFEQAIKNAQIAEKKYWQCKNFTAYFESLYLEALSFFNLEQYNECEQKIRHLLSVADEIQSAFHLANAYSLLGAMYMKLDNNARAKPFFEEAIRHELRNNRAEGMVSDYANLGIIARDAGDIDGALINFREAKRYADEVQNEELSAKIDQYINDLK